MGRSENIKKHFRPVANIGRPAPATSAFCISDLYVDPVIGIVRGRGGEVRLEPRVMSVLLALASDPGALHTREQLLHAYWSGGEIYCQALTQSIYQLRRQLASAGGACGYRDLVTTVPKRGYQLNAVVTPVDPLSGGDLVPAMVAPLLPSPSPTKKPRRLLPVVLAVLILVLLTVLLA